MNAWHESRSLDVSNFQSGHYNGTAWKGQKNTIDTGKEQGAPAEELFYLYIFNEILFLAKSGINLSL